MIHIPKGRAPASWISYMLAYIMRNSNQISMAIKLDVRKFFTRLSTSPTLAKISGDTNADARSVCGS